MVRRPGGPGGEVVRAVKVMARVVQLVQTFPVVPMVQVIGLLREVQVVRWSGGQVVRVAQVVSLDDMLSENIWFSCPKSSNN